MLKVLSKSLTSLLFIVAALLFTGCAAPERYIVVDGEALGTFVQVKCETTLSESEVAGIVAEIDSEAKSSMSIFNTESLISRINRGEVDSVDRHIAYNIELAQRFSALSEGAYDITIKPLTEVWGFGRSEAQESPNIDSILCFVGYEMIAVTEGRIVKSDPRVQIDLNSIAKGYTVDLVAEQLEARGIQNYMVNIGGEIRCKGVNAQGKLWSIGIETPYEGNMSMDSFEKIIEVENCAVATSGNYRRYYTTSDGRKVVHTLDPRTGVSVMSTLLSATIVAPTCAEADAAATMFMAMGSRESAIALAERCNEEMGWEYYFIFAGEEGYDVVCSEE